MQYRNPWFVHYFDMGHVKEPVISALAQDTKGRVWLGTDDGHAAFMEAGILNWLQTDIWPPGTTLYSMWIRHEDDVWVCTSQGLYRMGPKRVSTMAQHRACPRRTFTKLCPVRTVVYS
jgi:ligand-binding sensor domain-containing protein